MTLTQSDAATDLPLDEFAERSMVAAIDALRGKQNRDGHWCAELEGDSILQSEYLLMKWILGQEDQPLEDGRGPETLGRIVDQLRRQQREDGGWGQFPGSGIDLSATTVSKIKF